MPLPVVVNPPAWGHLFHSGDPAPESSSIRLVGKNDELIPSEEARQLLEPVLQAMEDESNKTKFVRTGLDPRQPYNRNVKIPNLPNGLPSAEASHNELERTSWEGLMQSSLDTPPRPAKKLDKSSPEPHRARIPTAVKTGQTRPKLIWTPSAPRRLSAGPMGHRRRPLSAYPLRLESYHGLGARKGRQIPIFSFDLAHHLLCDTKKQKELSVTTFVFGFRRQESYNDASIARKDGGVKMKRGIVRGVKKLFKKKAE